ncbi:MAG: flagellar export chaperone FliS [Actinomycetota bacterium]
MRRLPDDHGIDSVKLHQHYKSDAVSTASPARLVTMLYDRALQGLTATHGVLADGRGDMELANTELLHVQRIINELQVTLDHDRGGEIASNLDAIYAWSIEQLIEANLTKQPEPVRHVRDAIQGIRDAWVQATAGL